MNLRMDDVALNHRRRVWYEAGLRFECRRCGHCCRGAPGFVWVTRAALDRIAAFLKVDPDELRTTSVRRVGSRLSLLERPNGDCIFYADGCTVYPVRPEQCRTFPFWPEHLTRSVWDHLGEVECPGINRGRLWTRGEIDLLAGRGRCRPARATKRLEAALDGLRALYADLDQAVSPLAAACTACGRCCDFRTHGNVLYVTELERALLVRTRGAGDPDCLPGHCPYQAGAVCSAREVRPLGCRTYFCRLPAGETAQALYESFHRRLAALRQASGLPLAYAPLLE
jgi:Fe-S-cluster containining protein